ncbi:hypothetical protein Peur_019940 [Populus x canadensis]
MSLFPPVCNQIYASKKTISVDVRHQPYVASTKNEVIIKCTSTFPFSQSFYVPGNFQVLFPDSQETRSMEDEPKSPQYTLTWVVAAVCFVIALATIYAERVLHN